MATETEQFDHHRGGWRLAGLLVGVLLVVIVVEQYRGSQATPRGGHDPRFRSEGAAGEITLTMSREGEPPRRLKLPLTGSATLLDAMREAARRDSHWQIDLQERGKDAFVTSLSGVENDPAGGKYWFYEINGQRGELGIGACTVTAGDDILWKFAPYE